MKGIYAVIGLVLLVTGFLFFAYGASGFNWKTGSENGTDLNPTPEPTPEPSEPTAEQKAAFYAMGDVNHDLKIDQADLTAIQEHSTVAVPPAAYDSRYDLNGDGIVNNFDLIICAGNQGKGLWTISPFGSFETGTLGIILMVAGIICLVALGGKH